MPKWRRDKKAPFDVDDASVDEELRQIADEKARKADEEANRKAQELADKKAGKAHVQVVEPTPSDTQPETDLAPVTSPVDPAPVTTPSDTDVSVPADNPQGGVSTPTPVPPQPKDQSSARPTLSLPAQHSGDLVQPGRHRVSVADQNLVVPPVIGEGSKFGVAASDWWDVSKGKRWVQLTPSGLSSDVQCDAGTFGDLAVIGGSLRGLKHQIKGTQNEDSFFLGAAEDLNGAKYVVAVLADGLSSAKYSGYGSRRITQVVGREMIERISTTGSLSLDWMRTKSAGVLAETAERIAKYDPSDYGAPPVASTELGDRDVLVTLTIAVVPAQTSSDGSREVLAGFIGDSPLFVLNEDGWDKKTAVDDQEEMVENRTRAFPVDRTFSLTTFKMANDDAIVITSDGVGNFLMQGGNKLALGDFLQTQWRRPLGVLSFLSHLSFDLRSADDDRTAVVVWSATEQTD